MPNASKLLELPSQCGLMIQLSTFLQISELSSTSKFLKHLCTNCKLFIRNSKLNYRYGVIVKGDEKSWNVMLDRYVKEQNAQEKKKMLNGLCRIGEPWLIKRFLTLAQNETIVRSQDYFTALTYLTYNSVALPIVWSYVRQEWPALVERFSINSRSLGRLPKTVSKTFSTTLQLEEMKAFFAKYPEGGAGTRSRQQALEQIENNIRWLEKNEENISRWLQDNSPTLPKF